MRVRVRVRVRARVRVRVRVDVRRLCRALLVRRLSQGSHLPLMVSVVCIVSLVSVMSIVSRMNIVSIVVASRTCPSASISSACGG